MRMNSISVKNRQGAGGVVIFDPKPRFKDIFSSCTLDTKTEKECRALIKIEQLEDYFNY